MHKEIQILEENFVQVAQTARNALPGKVNSQSAQKSGEDLDRFCALCTKNQREQVPGKSQ